MLTKSSPSLLALSCSNTHRGSVQYKHMHSLSLVLVHIRGHVGVLLHSPLIHDTCNLNPRLFYSDLLKNMCKDKLTQNVKNSLQVLDFVPQKMDRH